MTKKLEAYRKKRDFEKTPEPKPKVKKSKEQNIFVVQQHHATRMHYDLRLEIDGVLKSWAVPKGPTLDPSQKRLAAETEDHPLDYATFEGIMPQGYGAGTVIVWDIGTYINTTEKKGKEILVADAYKQGHLKFILHGKRLRGEFALTRFKENDWLLIKLDDKYAKKGEIVEEKTRSVLSRKTIKSLDVAFKKLKQEH